MKSRTNTILVFLFALVAFTFASCSNGSDDDNAGGGSGILKATINGKEVVYTNVRARWVDNSNYLEIIGKHDNTNLMITILTDAQKVPAGSYSLDDNTPYSILAVHNEMLENNQQKNHTASRGTTWNDEFSFKIDEISSSNIKGSFSGIMVVGQASQVLSTMTVENGSFNIPLAN